MSIHLFYSSTDEKFFEARFGASDFKDFYHSIELFQDALVKIGKREGIFSLWSGLSPTLVLAVPATIVYFVSYEQLRIYIKVSCKCHCLAGFIIPESSVENINKAFFISFF